MRGGSGPIERNIASAVVRWVTTARMRRAPPQGQRQTSTPKVRIHGELLKLGFKVSQSTVAKWLPPRPPRGKPPSQLWRTFLRNHLAQAAAMDFFVIPTLSFGLLYGFVVLEHGRRRIRHVAITEKSTAEWTRVGAGELCAPDGRVHLLHIPAIFCSPLVTTSIQYRLRSLMDTKRSSTSHPLRSPRPTTSPTGRSSSSGSARTAR